MPNVLNEFAGDGVTKTFNFSMTGGYLSRDYVYFFTRPNDDLLNYTPYNDDDVTWLTDFSVRTANPIPVGTTFVILRSTTLNPLVDFQNTSRITEKNLDTATWQAVHIAAETSDTAGRIQVVAKAAKQESAQALAGAQAAAEYASTAAASAIAASTAASAAQVAALQAGSDAADAALSAATAAGVADAAALTANAANATAGAAAADAAAALTSAGNASDTANLAASKAGTAVNTANTALATANDASTASGSAVTTANSAAATANTALTIANEAKDLVDEAVSGAVVSFNGRAGAVAPQAGDYTKAMVGLGNVDNTPDLNKPISTAVIAALAANADADRARANHTGTQPITSITGLESQTSAGVVSAIAMAKTFTAVPATLQAMVIVVTQPHLRFMVWDGVKYVRAPWHMPGVLFFSHAPTVNVTHGIQVRADVTYKKEDYPDLAEILGVSGSTFVLPEGRARVLRAADNGRGIDTALVNGYLQEDAIRNLTGSFGVHVLNPPAALYEAGTGNGVFAGFAKRSKYYPLSTLGTVEANVGAIFPTGFDMDVSRQVPTAAENRVKSLSATLYITK